MRIKLHILVLLVVPILAMAEVQKPAATPEMLKANAERARAAAETSTGEACTEICMDAARKLTEVSNQHFEDGQVEAAQAYMKDAGKYAEKAGRASLESHKRQKQTEIGMRRLTKRMKDIVQTLNFEDRPPVEQVIMSIEKVRSELLLKMFGNPKKVFDEPDSKKKEKQ